MQAMVKHFFLFVLLVLVSGCVASGYGAPWKNSYARPAAEPPSSLLKDDNSYRPAGLTAPVERRLLTSEDTLSDSMPEEGTQYAQYTSRDSTQAQPRDFQATIGQRYTTPGGDALYPRSAMSSDAVTSISTLPPVKVALLVPLSGVHEDLGKSMLQAAQLALFDMGYEAFELLPRDTLGTPQGARLAAQSAVESGAQLILGPLFSSSVRSVQPVARRYGINVITFSTDWSLAGNNTFVMGFLPFAQIQRIAAYAVNNGMQNIGIFAPNTNYGNAVIAAYNSLAYRTGLTTAAVVRYPADESDVSGLIRSFTHYDERVEALNQFIRPLEVHLLSHPHDKAAQAELAALQKMDTWGEPPFDAVLLPVGGDQARSVSNLLSFYDLGPDEVKRLGTGLWDDPGLATESAMDNAWFAAPSPDLRFDFEQRYKKNFSRKPLRLATLAYDATALAAVLARNSHYKPGDGRSVFERTALTNPNGFAGIDGIFRFRPDGLVERGLAVLEFQHGEIVVIDPAPKTFQVWSGQ